MGSTIGRTIAMRVQAAAALMRRSAGDVAKSGFERKFVCSYAAAAWASRSALLCAQTRAVDDDGVAALAKSAQQRLGEGFVAEEVLPGEVR